MWVDNNIWFSTSILCTKKIISNYRTVHWRWKWTECHSVFLLTSISCWTILYNRKRIKNKRIKLKRSLTETRTKLLWTLFDETTDNEKINFCYTGFDGNIKICWKKNTKKNQCMKLKIWTNSLNSWMTWHPVTNSKYIHNNWRCV